MVEDDRPAIGTQQNNSAHDVPLTFRSSAQPRRETVSGSLPLSAHTPVGCELSGRAEGVWKCVIPGTPRQKGNSKRIVKFGARMALVGDRRSVKAQDDARAVAWAQRPPELLSSTGAPVALAVDVDFVFPIPTSRRKGKRAVKPGDPHTQRPDRGNLLKLVEDVLEAIAYADDCVVADGRVRKLWGDEGETRVTVRRL